MWGRRPCRAGRSRRFPGAGAVGVGGRRRSAAASAVRIGSGPVAAVGGGGAVVAVSRVGRRSAGRRSCRHRHRRRCSTVSACRRRWSRCRVGRTGCAGRCRWRRWCRRLGALVWVRGAGCRLGAVRAGCAGPGCAGAGWVVGVIPVRRSRQTPVRQSTLLAPRVRGSPGGFRGVGQPGRGFPDRGDLFARGRTLSARPCRLLRPTGSWCGLPGLCGAGRWRRRGRGR